MDGLIRIVAALFRTLGLALLAGTLVWAIGGFWLASKDGTEFEARHREWVTGLIAQRDQLKSSMDGVDRRRTAIREEISAQEKRAAQSARVIATLHSLESVWDRYVGNPEQQKANAEQIRHMEEMKTGAEAQIGELRREFTRRGWERDGFEGDLGKTQDELAFAEQHGSRFFYYQDRAWRRYKWVVIAAPPAYLLGLWWWVRRARVRN